jgi:DNA-binding CsgD family transcriptional regulator
MAQKEVLLSPRDTQIVRLLLDGYNPSSAAKFLQVSETTVRNHLTRLCRQCHVKDSSELIGLQWFMRLAVLVDGSE